jgi:hypothetical protein
LQKNIFGLLSIVVSLYWSLSGLVNQAPISKKITVGRPGDFSVEQLMAFDYVLIPKSISLKTFYYSMMISALLFLYIQKKRNGVAMLYKIAIVFFIAGLLVFNTVMY